MTIRDGIALYLHKSAQRTRDELLIFVHGANHASWCFDNLAGFFNEVGYDTLRFDWRGHGESEPLASEEAVRRTVENVVESDLASVVRYAEQQGYRRFVFVGHSMGSVIVQKFLETHAAVAAILLATGAPIEVGNGTAPFQPPANKLFKPPYLVARFTFFLGLPGRTARRYFAKLTPDSPAALAQVSSGRKKASA